MDVFSTMDNRNVELNVRYTGKFTKVKDYDNELLEITLKQFGKDITAILNAEEVIDLRNKLNQIIKMQFHIDEVKY